MPDISRDEDYKSESGSEYEVQDSDLEFPPYRDKRIVKKYESPDHSVNENSENSEKEDKSEQDSHSDYSNYFKSDDDVGDINN